MALAPGPRRSYLARQLGTMTLAQVRAGGPMAGARAAAWHNSIVRTGLGLPLFVVHDVGLLLTAPDAGSRLALPPPPPPLAELAPTLAAYRRLLGMIAASEVAGAVARWRLRDELIASLIARILADVFLAWPDRARSGSVEELPLEPALYTGDDDAACFASFDPAPLRSFLEVLAARSWHVLARVEQTDLDTLRLLGLFREGPADEAGGGAGLDLADLTRVLGSTVANDVVNFSLELIPRVLEAKRAGAAQTLAVDGYASVERKGSLDSLVLSELAYPDDIFERKLLDDELFYYAHERQREDEHVLHYLLVDASASMRGAREVFGRGLALTLVKRLTLEGEDVWVRFFDARLHDVVRVARVGSSWVPSFLAFRSERGRNPAKVFRQLALELPRLRRGGRGRIVLYVITHGQCHIPPEIVAELRAHALVYGVVILPSSAVKLDSLEHLDKVQVITAEALGSRGGRRDRALEVVDDARRVAAAAGAAREREA